MPRVSSITFILAALLAVVAVLPAPAAQRFPQPQFDVQYQMPRATEPAARADLLEKLDVAVLLAALSLAAWLILRLRRRVPVFLLVAFTIAYFGFYRKGCVCPIGSIQNVTAALADPATTLPASVLAFFVLPLLFALMFGRVFCAAVCPLGAVQDVVILKPVRIPPWIGRTLGLLPYVYLALAVLLASTGAGFVICRFDPFVSFFRLSGPLPILLAGGALLLLGVFIARPYCRFLCPYGVLLNWASRFSRWHMTITPDDCIQCRLCDTACPFDAIRSPDDNPPREAISTTRKRLAFLLAAAPLLVLLGALLGGLASPALARLHPSVRLAEQVLENDLGIAVSTEDPIVAFRSQGIAPSQLYRQAAVLQRQFLTGGRLAGAFLALVVAAALLSTATRRSRTDWEPDRATCLSCGRCFAYCPKEHQLRVPKSSAQKETHPSP